MKHLINLFLATFLVFSGTALAGEEAAAILKHFSGEIRVVRNQAELAPVAGMELMQSDVIVSGRGASGGVAFRDGTLLTLGESSEIEISQYLFRPAEARYGFSLYLRKGSAIYSSGKIGKLAPESIKLNTPRASVGVRGTRFIIKS